MHTTRHVPPPGDLARADRALRRPRGGPFREGGAEPSVLEAEPLHAIAPWQEDGVSGDWIAAPGTSGEAVVLYLPGHRAGHEEPPGVVAARLSAALGLPVLHLHPHDGAAADPWRGALALDDVLAAQRALARHRPASRVVLVGLSTGASLLLRALERSAADGMPLPAAAVALSPCAGPGPAAGGTGASEATGWDEEDAEPDAPQVRAARRAWRETAARSPLSYPQAALPPLLLACGGADPLAPGTVLFAEHAGDAGAEVDLDVFEDMPHTFPALPVEAARTLFARVARFVRAWLAGGPPGREASPLTIRRVGWAGYLITSEYGTRVLVDPYLRGGDEERDAGLPDSPVPARDLFDCHVVAVTHAGPDHRGQAVDIVKGGTALLASGTALRRHALALGVPPERCAAMVSGVELRVRDVCLKALDARHASSMPSGSEVLSDQPLSFLLRTAAGSSVLCGGDFSLSADMRTWGVLYAPQIAVLGIGGVRSGPVDVVELPPAEAARAADWLGVHTVVPVHYTPGDPAPAQLAADLAAAGGDVEVAALDLGETWTAEAPEGPQEGP